MSEKTIQVTGRYLGERVTCYELTTDGNYVLGTIEYEVQENERRAAKVRCFSDDDEDWAPPLSKPDKFHYVRDEIHASYLYLDPYREERINCAYMERIA